jgi:hypothetical protein
MKVKDIQPKNAQNVTAEIIGAWKVAHPRGVWELTVFKDEEDENGESKTGYVRKPTRKELSAAMTLKNDPMGQAEDILRSCWLGGDDELLEDEDYFAAAVSRFSDLMEVRRAELKKL